MGVNWRKYIEEMVSQCDILIAPIGENWISQLESHSDRDMVLFEIEVAIQRDIPIIPLAVADNRFPDRKELPESIKILADFNGMPIRPGRDFLQDIGLLTDAIVALSSTSSSNNVKEEDNYVTNINTPPADVSAWVVSKEKFAETTANLWATGGLNTIGSDYIDASKSDGIESLTSQILEMTEFFDINDLPFFIGEAHVSGNVGQTMRVTTYRMILTMPNNTVQVFPLKDIYSYTFKGPEGSLRGFFLGSTIKFDGVFGNIDLSLENIENLHFAFENVVNELRTLGLWKSLSDEILNSLGKTKSEILS